MPMSRGLGLLHTHQEASYASNNHKENIMRGVPVPLASLLVGLLLLCPIEGRGAERTPLALPPPQMEGWHTPDAGPQGPPVITGIPS